MAPRTPRPGLHDRSSGILLHPTSLPGPYGCGDLGPEAHRFVEFLHAAGQRYWQMLPVAPVGYGNSPYSALSAFAGNPLLISLDRLQEEGLLEQVPRPRLPVDRVDYERTRAFRRGQLRIAWGNFGRAGRSAFRRFCEEQAGWLEDYVLYRTIKQLHGERSWVEWAPELRDRKPAALERVRREMADELAFHRFEQWLFEKQWAELRAHAAALGVGLVGDLPIFVAHDSADVWANRELFFLDEAGQPTVIAGVPPDYFSATGQRWGNPLYRWQRLRRGGYGWWVERFRQTLHRFDAVRLDHFIGFTRYWEIPADEPTAINGKWLPGPGAHFFRAVQKALGTEELPLIAEDLGAVTPEVTALRDAFGMPGIRILQFAFGSDPQAPTFKPHHYPRNAAAYTGTHDNDTVVGWFHDPGGTGSNRTPAETEVERRYATRYLGCEAGEIHWDMIRALLVSVANLVFVPLQDVLGLGSEARMNRPGTAEGNWEWRFTRRDLTNSLAARLQQLVHDTDRGGGIAE
ncbi:4-alpha-glucanotransferase [Vulgatibacter sp.]|uniref:4-alpha-glucanotransferase n=1 Tax=Vulgatibacter sp. TaxID=1971226 RepID=UPI003567BE52